MAQLTIRELGSRLDAGENLPHRATEVFEAELREVQARGVANLHLELLAFLVDLREALVFLVAVLVGGIGWRGGAVAVGFVVVDDSAFAAPALESTVTLQLPFALLAEAPAARRLLGLVLPYTAAAV